MPYIQRDKQGKINGLYRLRQEGYAEELLADDHPEVVARRAEREAARKAIRDEEASLKDRLAVLEAEVAALKTERGQMTSSSLR